MDERSTLRSLTKSFDAADTYMSDLVISAQLLSNGLETPRCLWCSLLLGQVAWFRLLFGPAPVVSTWKGENTPLLSLALFISNIWQLAYSTWFNIFYMHFPLKIMSVTKPRDIRSHSSLVTTHTLPTPRAPIMSLGQVLGLPLFPLQMASFSHWTINIILFIPSQCLFRCPAWACGKPHF